MTSHEEFEEWFATTKYNNENAVWKPELNRYTVCSNKQFAWEVWNAARGMKYVCIRGYK